MSDYFHRQIQLWGSQKQELLSKKRIAIIGCGGLGSSLGIALGSSGIGTVHLVDFDRIETHNIHRQIAFTTEDEGEYKAEALAKLLQRRYPDLHCITHTVDFETFAKEEIPVDLILDATDNLPVRAKIDTYAKAHHTPWIYGSVEAFNGQVCFFDKSGFSAFAINNKQPEGIAAPIVMHIASLQANLALRHLVGLPVKKDLLYYLYFDSEGELITQKFMMPER
ncbi:MAG: thiamine biosynthesis protein ThiF [Campylobacteraceae bacterium 4484_4]|nr:MAG: thiamine biosynthesis protein ThiF [Campylobacteraceae bacterium 4484_4]